MTPGQITITSCGTMQGIYRPQMRVYYKSARHGILFETLTKPLRCRSRARAILRGKEWRASEDGIDALRGMFRKIAGDPENTIPEFNT